MDSKAVLLIRRPNSHNSDIPPWNRVITSIIDILEHLGIEISENNKSMSIMLCVDQNFNFLFWYNFALEAKTCDILF